MHACHVMQAFAPHTLIVSAPKYGN
jgi:hypothetical protein